MKMPSAIPGGLRALYESQAYEGSKCNLAYILCCSGYPAESLLLHDLNL